MTWYCKEEPCLYVQEAVKKVYIFIFDVVPLYPV